MSYKEVIAYIILGVLTSFFITKTVTAWLIPKLKSIKLGQKILDIGPRWHKNKEGTPTMGGLAFLVAFAVVFTALAVFAAIKGDVAPAAKLFFSMALILLSGAIGAIDDYAKFFKKQNQGLKPLPKFLMQLLVAGGYTAGIAWVNSFSTMLYIPFYGREVDFGVFWYVISVLLITGVINSVNLTDGIDGLASGVTFFVSCFFVVAGAVMASLGVVILGSVTIGITLGFLVYNFYPAKIFMGDTGSLFLGGCVVSMAYMLDNPLIILVVGIIYVIEAASVIIQVGVYKLTKKRVFKMAPIHHHFERCSWSETKIVTIFSLVTVLFVGLAYFGL
ncbi:MAG: phospho-N-acetylmuramoyl-pentapeptide-transferase [Clostridia bacterium]|nr:phospho-N-acetylmuramoyl-pentapeptide-transferase [Clostridia bacterium]